MKTHLLLALALLPLGCAKAPVLTAAATSAAALVRLDEELAILVPLVAADSASQPLRRYYTFSPAPAGKPFSLTDAKQLLRESPDILNQIAELPFLSSLTSKTQQAARINRLRALLHSQPTLDLGWLWLAAAQKDSSQQAIASLSRALALNQQVGAYYRQRAKCYRQQGQYLAAAQDLRRALPLYHTRWEVYLELADTYAQLHNDQQYSAIWNQRQAEMSLALHSLEHRAGPDVFSQDSMRRLREEIAFGYLAKALYFIEQRHQPALGCPALAQAAAAGVVEAPELQRHYCR